MRLTAALDQGKKLPVEETIGALSDRRLADFLINTLGRSKLDCLDDEDSFTLSEKFHDLAEQDIHSDHGIEQNGLCILILFTLELMESGDWTSFDELEAD